MSQIFIIFVLLRFGQYGIEKWLSFLNRQYYLDRSNQAEAMQALGISREAMDKSLAYSTDKYKFAQVVGFINVTALLWVIAAGGLGWVESVALSFAGDGKPIYAGVIFFAIIGLVSMVYGIPFSLYNTFVIEERHGFNRQTVKGFFLDQVKGLAIAAVLGLPILMLLLWIMQVAGQLWWIWAWVAVSSFSVLTAWLYPTLLAPLFNKFKPLEEGELKSKIFELANKVNFNATGLYVMDASIRSSHGNAYFTGLFGKKRIVLFDTLLEALNVREVVAVLAHELGHFKLNHVRWMLIRSVLMTGLTFYLLSLVLPLEQFYHAFKLQGVSSYGALVVFSLWFGLIDFVLSPIETYLSRRNEFAADRFALTHVHDRNELGNALLKLREKSHSMPISHPWFSGFYYSHPPMMERLRAMDFVRPTEV